MNESLFDPVEKPAVPAWLRPALALSGGRLSEDLRLDLTLIIETFQHTGSFKFRAAYSVASSVPNGFLLAASSGNFGQALAAACRLLGKRCTVVMPVSSARVKIDAVRSWGAEVDLIDPSSISRAARVAELASRHPDAYVASAYDDWHVIRGNASLGREIARLGDFDDVIVPVGGGGLSAGVALGLRELGSGAQLWGAEPLLANDAARSFREGKRISLEREPMTLADGARTLALGEKNWEILRRELAGVLEVSEAGIARAVRRLFLERNLKVEPTGALAVAALVEHPERFRARRVAAVVSGGNVDPELFARLLLEESGPAAASSGAEPDRKPAGRE